MEGSVFTRAQAANAQLKNCRLQRADFRSAALRNTNFHGSVLCEAIFDEAQCEGASLGHADL